MRAKIERAKADIMKLFERFDTLDFCTVSEELDLDLDVVVRACKDLEAEGKIEFM